MNTTINVEPGKLEETAARVEAFDGDYQRLYQSLYAEVDKLSGSWGGKDNVAFNGRIKSYEDDFRQISILIRQYAAFLRASARAYREIQDELAGSASRLKA